MLSDLLTLVVLFAPPLDLCDEAAMDAFIKQGQHSAILKRARACLKQTGRPYFHHVAGQALEFLDRPAEAKREWGLFLKKAPPSDKHHADAKRRYDKISVPAAAVKRPKPQKSATPEPPDTTKQPDITTQPDTTATPPETTPPANTPPETTPPETIKQTGTTSPVTPPEKALTLVKTDKPAPPSFRRGWIGLGVTAGITGATGLAFGVTGGLVGKHAFESDARALAAAGLSASFPYASCRLMSSADCRAADDIERNGYATASFHRDLALASRLQAVAVMASSAGIGGLLGALPIRGRSVKTRRIGFIVVFGGGLAIAAAGAAMYGVSRASLGDSLQGIDGDRGMWRTTRDEYWRHQSRSLAGGGLLGLGAGVLVGAGVAALTLNHSSSPRRAQLRLVPNLGGLSLIGRF